MFLVALVLNVYVDMMHFRFVYADAAEYKLPKLKRKT